MADAIRLAWRGLYTTHPNPRVGCVIVNNGAVVGQGWHQIAGAQAEIARLPAGDRANGVTAVPFRAPMDSTYLFERRPDGTYVLDGKAGDYFGTDRFEYDYEQPAVGVAQVATKPAPAVKGTVKKGVASVTLPALSASHAARPGAAGGCCARRRSPSPAAARCATRR